MCDSVKESYICVDFDCVQSQSQLLLHCNHTVNYIDGR